MHTVQTAGLALATDLSPPHKHPQVVGLMSVMLLVGMLCSALVFGQLLADYSPGRLVQVVQAAALTTLVLNVLAMWKQEPRSRQRKPGTPLPETFSEAWQAFSGAPQVLRRLLVVALGTLAFAMEDVLLEPYGGAVLGMSVADTTRLTATLSLGGLLGFAWASRVLGRGAEPLRMAAWGAVVGMPAFAAVIVSGWLGSTALFSLGVFAMGVGVGLFGHGTLTATMRSAPEDRWAWRWAPGARCRPVPVAWRWPSGVCCATALNGWAPAAVTTPSTPSKSSCWPPPCGCCGHSCPHALHVQRPSCTMAEPLRWPCFSFRRQP